MSSRRAQDAMNRKVKTFVAATASIGLMVIVYAVLHWQSSDPIRFVCYLGIALLASSLKVSLPGIDGTMSVNFLFILIGILELSFPETLVLGCAATLTQCYWRVKSRVQPIHVIFNVAGMMAPAIAASYLAFHLFKPLLHGSTPLLLLVAACAYFVTNTVPVGIVISLAEKKSFRKIWKECYFWSFPYYLVGAGIAGLVSYVNRYVSWQTSLLVLPVVYWIFRSYRLYLGRLEDEKRHVEAMAALHLRTIEALALAIDAKDHTTHDHLQRVRVYAVEIGKELGLCDGELEALKAAALLHDIGKLAVPEHIINKPGKLTEEEFEKMMIHPVVGAEILERVNFPYPVAPIVRSHHEKWDGTGYPDGLKGEEIPLAARVLTAVDCLDAMASDRQYRRALPLDKAMEHVARLSGRDFDPQVIEILARRYVELEQMAHLQPAPELASPMHVIVDETGSINAPDAGFEQEAPSRHAHDGDFLASIASARQEAQMLFELSHDLGKSLSIDDTLSVVAARLRRMVAYDAIAFWLREDDVLVPKHVSGENFRLFSSMQIPLGLGLSGWVVQNCKPILNGNPSVEPGYINDSSKFSTLQSAVSVPLEGLGGIIGALTLYQSEPDAFSKDHLRVLMAISSKVALSIENALKFQQAQSSATTDYLTGLPNARSLFLHLDGEVARCKRTNTRAAVMVCDLNGFKHINDRFGHLEGNKVLHLFAQGLRETCREYDYVARMGGDEFVIVAPGLEPKVVPNKAALMNNIARAAGFAVSPEAELSVSIGCAFYPNDGTDAEQLLAEADRRMYSAKREHHERGENATLPASSLLATNVN
jgi:diguanylate cyclase (GGDEF)-like protein/putative nucleotidyltransferase with HDIG domain